METGTVRKFERSFGFIATDNGQRDVFVHYSDIVGEGFKELYEGDRVEYELGYHNGKPTAKNVTLVKRAERQPRFESNETGWGDDYAGN